MLADGKVDATALVTGTVGLDGVANAFDTLAEPDHHARSSSSTQPAPSTATGNV